jgi:hypothetical protein
VKEGEYPFLVHGTARKTEEHTKESDEEWEEDKEFKRALEMSTEKPSNTTDVEGSLPLSVDDVTDVEASRLPLSVDASEHVDGYESSSSLPPLVSAESDDNSDSDSTEKNGYSPPGSPLDSDSDASLPALIDDSDSDSSNSD